MAARRAATKWKLTLIETNLFMHQQAWGQPFRTYRARNLSSEGRSSFLGVLAQFDPLHSHFLCDAEPMTQVYKMEADMGSVSLPPQDATIVLAPNDMSQARTQLPYITRRNNARPSNISRADLSIPSRYRMYDGLTFGLQAQQAMHDSVAWQESIQEGNNILEHASPVQDDSGGHLSHLKRTGHGEGRSRANDYRPERGAESAQTLPILRKSQSHHCY